MNSIICGVLITLLVISNLFFIGLLEATKTKLQLAEFEARHFESMYNDWNPNGDNLVIEGTNRTVIPANEMFKGCVFHGSPFIKEEK